MIFFCEKAALAEAKRGDHGIELLRCLLVGVCCVDSGYSQIVSEKNIK